MRYPGLIGDFWPLPTDVLILQAALLEPDRAAKAWAEVRPNFDMDAVHGPRHRVFPLLYHNLKAAGVDDPDLNRLKGIWRQTWVRNQQRSLMLAETGTHLRGEGIATMVLKGMAVAPRYYEDFGARPMGDLDLLVHRTDAARAIRALLATGWSLNPIPPRGEAPSFVPDVDWLISLKHAASLERPDGTPLDLHWVLGPQFVSQAVRISDMADFWQAAQPLTIAGFETLALCPTDQVFHTSTHAMHARAATLMWAADIVTIVRVAGDEIDWERVLDQAHRRDSTLAMRDALTYVVQELDAPVPAEVVSRLWATRVTARESLARRASTRSDHAMLGSLVTLAGLHARLSTDTGLTRTVAGFPAFLREYWRVDRLGQLPSVAVRKVARRVKHLSSR